LQFFGDTYVGFGHYMSM